MRNADSEFDFDCPHYSYDLKTHDCKPEDQSKYIDPWFLTYHVDHDRRKSQQPDVEKEKCSQTKVSSSNPVKNLTLGPARSAKRMSTTSSSSIQSSYVSAKRCSQKGEELRIEDVKNLYSEKTNRALTGLKRKSLVEDTVDNKESIQGGSTGSTDLQDKLDEFRLRRKKDTAVEISNTLPIPKAPIPQTDYSRSKIVTTGTGLEGSRSVGSTTAAKLAFAKKLTSGVNKTSTGVQSATSASSSSSKSTPALGTSSSASRLATRSSAPSSASTNSTTRNASKPSSKAVIKSNDAVDSDISMIELLKKHNQRFAPIPIYEPPRHSVRDVRKWEKSTGKIWSSLRPEEREVANAEIGKIKEVALLESQR